jgi:hypothetical protein
MTGPKEFVNYRRAYGASATENKYAHPQLPALKKPQLNRYWIVLAGPSRAQGRCRSADSNPNRRGRNSVYSLLAKIQEERRGPLRSVTQLVTSQRMHIAPDLKRCLRWARLRPLEKSA